MRRGTCEPLKAVILSKEEALLSRAADKRRREFAAARGCARSTARFRNCTSAHLDRRSAALRSGRQASSEALRTAAGTRRQQSHAPRDVLTIGLDAEPDAALPDGVLEVVATR